MTTQLFLHPIQNDRSAGEGDRLRGPSLSLVRSFIRRVEQQDYVGAIAHFYHDDASVQENQDPPRCGRSALLAHEMDLMVRYGNIPVRKVERFAITGNMVFINWVFELNTPSLGKRVFDEVAMQHWDGDRIRRERFYYDPQQLVPTI